MRERIWKRILYLSMKLSVIAFSRIDACTTSISPVEKTEDGYVCIVSHSKACAWRKAEKLVDEVIGAGDESLH